MGKRSPSLISLRLPYPPSANRMYRTFRGRTTLTQAVRDYRRQVAEVWFQSRIKGQRGFDTGELALRIRAYRPDKRRRDVDNILKVLCDALQHAGVIGNDSQFREIVVSFEETKPGGELRIEIRRLSLSQKGHA